jgi:pimeloyl-ACP methyl ester carboxylesterase
MGDAARLSVTEQGDPDGPLVVLVHGAMDRSRSLRRVVERLPDLHVVAYDRRGYGDSVPAGPPSGLAQHVADLLEVLAGRRATVVAHSFGCHIGVLASIAHPEVVAALGLWEPPVPWMDFWPERSKRVVAGIVAAGDPGAVAEAGAKSMLGDEGWARLSEEARAQRRAEGPALVTDIASELEPLYDLADVTVPCLVGYGGDTWPYSSDASQRVAAMVGCEPFVVEGAPHMGHATHPDGFAGFVRSAVALGT